MAVNETNMRPFEMATQDADKSKLRTGLKLSTMQSTPNTTPGRAHDSGFDWNQWDGSGWHNQPWPRDDINRGRGKLFPAYALPEIVVLISRLKLDLTSSHRYSASFPPIATFSRAAISPSRRFLRPFLSTKMPSLRLDHQPARSRQSVHLRASVPRHSIRDDLSRHRNPAA